MKKQKFISLLCAGSMLAAQGSTFAASTDKVFTTDNEKSIDFNFSKEVPSHFAAECNGSKRGARDLRNMIRKGIEDKIINTMIENTDRFLSGVSVSIKEKELVIDYKF